MRCIGIRVDKDGNPVDVKNEADHFYTCAACGQAVDKRDLGQVFHHEDVGHEPLLLDS